MTHIFELSLYMSFAFFTVLGVLFYAFGNFALIILSRHTSNDILSVPIGAFMGTIATAWALSLGFVAADIWAVNSKADQATSEERSAITRLVGTAQPEILDQPELLKSLQDYQAAVVEQEWGENINIDPSSLVEKSLQDIRREIVNLSRSDTPIPILMQMINDFDNLQDARNMRLAVGSTSIDSYKWYLVLILTLLTLITIAATHADRERAAKKALIIYSITAAFCLCILAIHASPYQGIDRLTPTLLYTNHKLA